MFTIPYSAYHLIFVWFTSPCRTAESEQKGVQQYWLCFFLWQALAQFQVLLHSVQQ